MMLKRCLALLLSLLLLLGLAACKKDPEPEPPTGDPTPKPDTKEEETTLFASGTVEGITWEVHTNGVMYLKGSGALPDYDDVTKSDPWIDQPWYEHGGENGTRRSDAEMGTIPVTKLIVGEGITALGAHAFSHFESLLAVELPSTLTTVSYKAFANCKKLRTVSGGIGVVTVESEAFRGCTDLASIDLSTPLATVQSSAFDDLRSLADADWKLTLRFHGTEEQWLATRNAMTVENGNDILFSGSVVEYVTP